jgi:hypothetical protein
MFFQRLNIDPFRKTQRVNKSLKADLYINLKRNLKNLTNKIS